MLQTTFVLDTVNAHFAAYAAFKVEFQSLFVLLMLAVQLSRFAMTLAHFCFD